jgi:hypothetical protein
LEELVKERERAQAATSRKEDVAKRPASYKSALSLQLPVGTTRSQKDRRRDGQESPERRQHVYVENRGAMMPSTDDHHQKGKDDGSTFEKMKILKEKYGEGASG